MKILCIFLGKFACAFKEENAVKCSLPENTRKKCNQNLMVPFGKLKILL